MDTARALLNGLTRRPAPAVPALMTDAATGVLASLVLLVAQGLAGFPTLHDSGGDNDSLLRLVEVRDLIAGQGWYDLLLTRMGTEGGFLMHWSRLVDAPIAAIILLGSAVSGSQAVGETAALLAWPLGLFALAVFLLLRLTRELAGEAALLPAAVVGGAGLYYTAIFLPGVLDHHNIQLVLTLAVMLALARSNRSAAAPAVAGLLAAVMLAVGMETAPFVAAAGFFAAMALAVDAVGGRRTAFGFGLAFAGASAVAFVATVPPHAWASARCDSFSIVHLVLGSAGGVGLAVIALLTSPGVGRTGRLAAIAGLGVAAAILAVVFFPHCLADPYAGLDVDLKRFWLTAVSEAQPAWRVVESDWQLAGGYYVTPLLGLVVLPWLRGRGTAPWWVGVIFLVVAIAVSVWQVRGARFAVPLATLPLAAWIGQVRQAAELRRGLAASLLLISAWLASLNVAWAALGSFLPGPQGNQFAAAGEQSRCERAEDYARLSGFAPTTVLGISNLGSPILAHTPHRVLSGPYHRNIDGNLAALRAFMGSPEDAAAIARAHTVGLVVVCRGNGETQALAGWAPDGLLARLLRGEQPVWLEELPGRPGEALEIYSVRPTR